MAPPADTTIRRELPVLPRCHSISFGRAADARVLAKPSGCAQSTSDPIAASAISAFRRPL